MDVTILDPIYRWGGETVSASEFFQKLNKDEEMRRLFEAQAKKARDFADIACKFTRSRNA